MRAHTTFPKPKSEVYQLGSLAVPVHQSWIDRAIHGHSLGLTHLVPVLAVIQPTCGLHHLSKHGRPQTKFTRMPNLLKTVAKETTCPCPPIEVDENNDQLVQSR